MYSENMLQNRGRRAGGCSRAHVLTVVKCHIPWCMRVCIEKDLRYRVANDLYSNSNMSKTTPEHERKQKAGCRRARLLLVTLLRGQPRVLPQKAGEM